jgi:hypothetical protein
VRGVFFFFDSGPFLASDHPPTTRVTDFLPAPWTKSSEKNDVRRGFVTKAKGRWALCSCYYRLVKEGLPEAVFVLAFGCFFPLPLLVATRVRGIYAHVSHVVSCARGQAVGCAWCWQVLGRWLRCVQWPLQANGRLFCGYTRAVSALRALPKSPLPLPPGCLVRLPAAWA